MTNKKQDTKREQNAQDDAAAKDQAREEIKEQNAVKRPEAETAYMEQQAEAGG